MTCTVLSIEYESLAALQAAFMPVFDHGGLFVPGYKGAALGRRFFLLLTLPGQTGPLPALARCAWIQPARNARRRPGGLGLRFDADCAHLRERIEGLLAAREFKDVPSHTF
ncbi:MAG: hypothetical protein WD396_08700 [Pseudohongiellaceae bacterium]